MDGHLFYEHPTLGQLPLVPHPTKPWRLVALWQGTEIYECDVPKVTWRPQDAATATADDDAPPPAKQHLRAETEIVDTPPDDVQE